MGNRKDAKTPNNENVNNLGFKDILGRTDITTHTYFTMRGETGKEKYILKSLNLLLISL